MNIRVIDFIQMVCYLLVVGATLSMFKDIVQMRNVYKRKYGRLSRTLAINIIAEKFIYIVFISISIGALVKHISVGRMIIELIVSVIPY